MAEQGLPPYVSAIASLFDWPGVLKMHFPRVELRYYPLKADIGRLQRLCDQYLNFANEKDEIPPVYFKAAAPIVLLHVINYGRLEIEQLGWLHQHELLFGIPLEWYVREGDKLVFKDWGLLTPFMYLDNPISIWFGREIYGWPKVPVDLPRIYPTLDPSKPECVFAFNLATPSAKNPDKPELFARFVEMYEERDNLSWPPWQTSNPWMALPRAFSASLSSASAAWGAMLAMWTAPGGAGDFASMAAMARRGLDYFYEAIPDYVNLVTRGKMGPGQILTQPFMRNNIALKQFRDAENPASACYQSIVRSSAVVTQVRDTGLLFNPVYADPTGGASIKLYQFPTQPLVDTLGLEVSGQGSDARGSFSVVRPLYPFYQILDLGYGQAETLCWRSKTTSWSTTENPGKPRTREADYVRVGSGISEEIPFRGRYDFTMGVLPLAADRAKLVRLCEDYLNKDGYRFEPSGDYVCLLLSQFIMSPEHGPARDSRYADSEVGFAIPGICRPPDGSERSMLLPMMNLVGAAWDAITDREIYGRFSLQASFLAPRVRVGDYIRSVNDRLQDLFYVKTSLTPKLNEEDEIRRRMLLDIQGKLYAERREAEVEGLLTEIAEHGPEIKELLAEKTQRNEKIKTLLEQLSAEAAKAKERSVAKTLDEWIRELGLGTLLKNYYESVALKQFRDISDADRACYQALVLTGGEFADLKTEWITRPLEVVIHEYESIDLAGTFGLKGHRIGFDEQHRHLFLVDPVKPFLLTATMRQAQSKNLCWRAGAMPWQKGAYRESSGA